MYEQERPKIYAINKNEVEIESEQVIPERPEWSHKPSWENSVVRVGSLSVASIEARPRRRGTSRPLPEHFAWHDNSWVRQEGNLIPDESSPESLPAFQALCWTEEDQNLTGVDYRPHLQDPSHGSLLVDSGSQISAFPPEPGDVEVKGACLKAVNGSRIKCYGKKRVEIKIGRKTYHHEVFKAEVEKPVLGWDFVRRNRLEIIWNDFGDNLIVDRKAKVSQILE